MASQYDVLLEDAPAASPYDALLDEAPQANPYDALLVEEKPGEAASIAERYTNPPIPADDFTPRVVEGTIAGLPGEVVPTTSQYIPPLQRVDGERLARLHPELLVFDPKKDAANREREKELGIPPFSLGPSNVQEAISKSQPLQLQEPMFELPKPENKGVTTGIIRGVESVVESLTTPENIGLMVPIARAPKLVQQAAALGFGTVMIKGGTDALFMEAPANETPGQKAERITGGIASVLLGALGIKHGVSRQPQGKGSRPALMPEEQIDRIIGLRKISETLPDGTVKDRITASPESIDGAVLAREKLLEEFNTLPVEMQKARQKSIDEIDENLLRLPREDVRASEARVKERGLSKPPAEGAVPPVATGGPRDNVGTSSLFEQARREAEALVTETAAPDNIRPATQEAVPPLKAGEVAPGPLVEGAKVPEQIKPSAETGKAATAESTTEPLPRVAEGEPVGGPGAMGPVEAAENAANRTSTGLKRSIVDTERLSREAEPIPTVERQREAEVVSAAEDRVDADPTVAPSLVARIVDKGEKAISEQDAAVLLVERQRIMNERAAWEERLANGEEVATAKPKLAELETALERIDQAQRAAGSSWGRLGHMYQRMIREDFTLDAMERKMRAKLERPLNEAERTKIKEQADKIADLQKQSEANKTSEADTAVDLEIERIYEATINELGKEYLSKPTYGKQVFDIARKVVDRWKVEAEVAHTDLRKALGLQLAGIPNPAVVLHVGKILRAWIGEIGLNKAEATARLVSEFGEKIKPHINAGWSKAQELIGMEKTDSKAKEVVKKGIKKKGEATPNDVKARAKAESVAGEELSHKTVFEYVRSLINEGTHGEKELMKAAHEGLKEYYPALTERDVRRAYSEYGKVKFPSKEAVAVEMSELRTLTRLQESIDRMTEGRDALHSGLQRDKATQAIREKQKQVNELLKQRKGPPSPEKLASREDAKQTALRNAIADLDKQLRTGEKPIKGEPAPDSLQTEQLKAERDAMKAKLKDIEDAANPGKSAADKQLEALAKIRDRLDDTLAGKRDPKSPKDFEPLSAAADDLKAEIVAMQELAAQMRRDAKPKADPGAAKEAAQIKALEGAIKRYEEKIAAGDFSTKGKMHGPDSAKVAALKEIRDARIDAYNAAKKAGKPVRTKEEIYNATRMKAVEKQIADLQAKIAAGNFTRKAKPTPIAKTKAVMDAELALTAEKQKFNKGLFEAEQANRTTGKKIWDGIKQTRGAFVNIASSFDLSAPRQALVAILSNIGRLPTSPIRGARMLGKPMVEMFKAWSSETRAKEIEYKIQNRPNAKSGADKAAGIEYSSLDHSTFTKIEENARSVLDDWAELPLRTGNPIKTAVTLAPKLGAKGIRMSNRAFISFLNSTRASLFDELLASNFKDRAPTNTELQVIGNMVNIATGRGKLNPMTARVASEVLWAPKLLASRIQFLIGQPLWGGGKWAGSGRARAIVAKEYARIIAGGYLLYQVAQLFDEKKEKDPTSSDFGKIVRGKTRIDPWGGFQQVTVLGAKVFTARDKTIAGKERDIGADRKFGVNGMFFNAAKFFRSKFRPDVGALVDILDRENIVGDETTKEMVAQNLLVPLPLRSVEELIKDRGFTEAAIIQMIAEFGAGVSTYGDKKKAREAQR